MTDVDAVVVGAGHHGLVAAATLADAGWEVVLLESRDVVGGAIASREIDGFVMDEFSACHPLAAASPVLQGLDLDRFGLRWAHAERPLVHLGAPERPAAVLASSPEETARRLGADHPADGDTWLALVEHYRRIREPLLAALLTRWPPVRPGVALVRAAGLATLGDLARFLLLPVTRMGVELFEGDAGRDLIAGNAMHSDVPPTAPVSGMFGWLMTMLAQDVGFPSPVGGSRALAQALRARAEATGVEVRTGTQVTAVEPRSPGATVRTEGGDTYRARRAVLADVSAPDLYERLLPAGSVPAGLQRRLAETFEWDLPTVKLNYRLAAPMPWRDPAAHGAAVVHLGRTTPGLVEWSAGLEAGHLPSEPFALVGQMTTIDATRSSAGTEALWAYTHLPRGRTDADAVTHVTTAYEDMADAYAPGWRDLVLERWVQSPTELERSNQNLGQGAVGGGTQQLFQQTIWRPVTSLGGPRTVVPGVYLASAAIHPGGGVHGGCGYIAARAALQDAAWWGRPGAGLQRAALRRMYARVDWLRG